MIRPKSWISNVMSASLLTIIIVDYLIVHFVKGHTIWYGFQAKIPYYDKVILPIIKTLFKTYIFSHRYRVIYIKL